MLKKIWEFISYQGIILFIVAGFLSGSVLIEQNTAQKAHLYTRDIEFDYLSWTLRAAGVRIKHIALGSARYLKRSSNQNVVLNYLNIIEQIHQKESQLTEIYSNPIIENPESASESIRTELMGLYKIRSEKEPIVEEIIQLQISEVASEIGLFPAKVLIPPVLYNSDDLPKALVISPREMIRQDAQISLDLDFPLFDQIALEEKVDRELDVSSLVVNIGGIGIYPTMVMRTTSINWLVEVVAHEWVHNFLSLRPLGIYYSESPELRTINETTASIAGKEIARQVIAKFYPEHLPPPPIATREDNGDSDLSPPVFDFRAEMRITRIEADHLLEAGKITEAEAYMMARRQVFWDNGYRSLRKINQAYFAFHGAYADQPGGASGDDPVGEAVRNFRKRSPNLKSFLSRISWMISYNQLQSAVDNP